MSSAPIQLGAAGVDLSSRFRFSITVAASPAAAVETTICTLTLPRGLTITQGVFLEAVAAFTVGTNGTGSTLRIRQTDTSGTVIYSSGLLASAAATLQNIAAQGIDASPASTGQVYVVTLTVAAATAPSTVSAVSLQAIVI